MKDFGQLKCFLGLEVNTNASGIFLHQHKYMQDMVELVGLQDSSPPVDTPLEVNTKYHIDESEALLDPLLNHQLVGSLNYMTRPDILFVVQQVSQFIQCPQHIHLVAICCIFSIPSKLFI